ncbi:DUF3267 domain-containing protein [Niallia sp. XMNu-256]|uniref:DUF3267 domain-containing protein n=1 Tax=Niallia sp. XMNu-256 TaxID=3082444 RepID=UPI0030D1A93F
MKQSIEVTVDPRYMNRKASIYTIIIGILAFIAFFSIWGFEFNFSLDFLWKFYLGYVVGVIIHEALHGFGFIVFGKAKITEVKFGFILKHITPYAHCKVPIKVKAYRIALLLPVILTGIIPLILALAIGNGLLLAISVFLMAGGIGDWIIFRKIKPYSGNALLEDHPNAIGCIIYKG